MFIIILNTFAFAQKSDHEKIFFDDENANQKFNVIQKKLETRHDYANTIFYVQQIENLQNEAKKMRQRCRFTS